MPSTLHATLTWSVTVSSRGVESSNASWVGTACQPSLIPMSTPRSPPRRLSGRIPALPCARRPGYFNSCGCHCFTEDEAENEGAGYNGWSEIEARARATQVVDSAVMYAAHATLQRGFAYDAGQGHAWLTGTGGSVSRFVESTASKARIAHLVSGYRDTGSRSTMVLGSTPLVYFENTAPTWWPNTAGDSWRKHPNNTDPGTSTGLVFWADVCASWCVRRFDDESEFMDVDFTVKYGVANHGRCSCYAYQDTSSDSTHAGNNSHAAPDDLRAMEFLHEFMKIPSNQPNNTHVFAMKKDVGHGLWIPRLQSTVYSRRLFQSGIDVADNVLTSAPLLTGKTHLFYAIFSADSCIEMCAVEAVNHKRYVKTARFDPVKRHCHCFDESLLEWRFDSIDDPANLLWSRLDTTTEWYDLTFCEFVRPDEHGRTMVWSKSLVAPGTSNGWCSGSPAGAGYVLNSGNVLASYQNGQSSAVSDPLWLHIRLSAALTPERGLCLVRSHSTSCAKSSVKYTSTVPTPASLSKRLSIMIWYFSSL